MRFCTYGVPRLGATLVRAACGEIVHSLGVAPGLMYLASLQVLYTTALGRGISGFRS